MTNAYTPNPDDDGGDPQQGGGRNTSVQAAAPEVNSEGLPGRIRLARANIASLLVIAWWCYVLLASRGEASGELGFSPTDAPPLPAYWLAWMLAVVQTVGLLSLAILCLRSMRISLRLLIASATMLGLSAPLFGPYDHGLEDIQMKLLLLGAALVISTVLWSPALVVFGFLRPLGKWELFVRLPGRMLPPMAAISLVGFLLVPSLDDLPRTHRPWGRSPEEQEAFRTAEQGKLSRALSKFDGLIQAIQSFEADYGAPPLTIERLVPDYLASLDRDQVPVAPIWHYVPPRDGQPTWLLEIRNCPYVGSMCLVFLPRTSAQDIRAADAYLEHFTSPFQTVPLDGEPKLGTWFSSSWDFPRSKRR